MTAPYSGISVELPMLTWGDPAAARSALLLHGLTSAGAVWWRVASGLAAEGWFVVAPDQRGHGRAPRTTSYPLAGFVADTLRLRPAHGKPWDLVVGHSLGGAVALLAAAGSEDWTRSVLLLDPPLTLGPGSVAPLLAETIAEITDPNASQILSENPGWHAEDAHQKVEAARVVSPFTVERVLSDTSPWDLEPHLDDVRVPIRLLGADPASGSASVLPEQGERLAARHANLSYAFVAGAGHSIHRDSADRVIAEALQATITGAPATNP
ncbi:MULTISPECIES: alpha/beta hydrolase [unclassified Cryobacterium]|uniref:alpha/beta fold hydrolase n=1 Tax=unclassified Cryobacterium TaxID=2649013 RepID=UPI002AB34A42|nr:MULTISPECIES: alpha/beta hydrolase [unclassified Cryobacterium]MDY7543440.1 alpha/beta hydrolase [Cryobacterium sp. 5B3]MEA9999552.1 alpha/beta hydrolase [Cryobacterium sp. RTS3]MEB0264915.1 alpha/beta hydrolase [Cryobacterium sp. 10I5]MEB0274671.1 alpha/beta hydrolase [Cryobacterium sp. 5B3]